MIRISIQVRTRDTPLKIVWIRLGPATTATRLVQLNSTPAGKLYLYGGNEVLDVILRNVSCRILVSTRETGILYVE